MLGFLNRRGTSNQPFNSIPAPRAKRSPSACLYYKSPIKLGRIQRQACLSVNLTAANARSICHLTAMQFGLARVAENESQIVYVKNDDSKQIGEQTLAIRVILKCRSDYETSIIVTAHKEVKVPIELEDLKSTFDLFCGTVAKVAPKRGRIVH